MPRGELIVNVLYRVGGQTASTYCDEADPLHSARLAELGLAELKSIIKKTGGSR